MLLPPILTDRRNRALARACGKRIGVVGKLSRVLRRRRRAHLFTERTCPVQSSRKAIGI